MRKRGFTLVELLVVIGIIAVLISILLPSLAKARQHANNVMCASNLRSVGQGLLFYANEHKGKLPFSGAADWEHIWPAQVTMQLGGTLQPTGDQWGNVTGTYAAVLRCPDAPIDGGTDIWNGGFHYTANCRAMPASGDADGMRNNAKMLAYPLATKDASSKMLMWDGPILADFGWNAPANNRAQNSWFITWGGADGNNYVNWWADPQPGFNMDRVVPPATDGSYVDLNPTSAKYIGIVNRDSGPGSGELPYNISTVGFQRYRHLGNTSGNFLYFDGHVESKKIGTVTYRDISIFPW